ncbi:hypothetical protein Hanom_Chr09g00862581 [Helianthus anomalus]
MMMMTTALPSTQQLAPIVSILFSPFADYPLHIIQPSTNHKNGNQNLYKKYHVYSSNISLELNKMFILLERNKML